jgi:sugar lactone lactonase YvrE
MIPVAVIFLLLGLMISTARPVLAFSNGQSAALVIGQTNFTNSTAATTASGFYDPHGIALDSSGNLWVVEIGNARVLEFIPPFSTGESASVVIGQPNFTTNSEPIGPELNDPCCLAFDPHGNLWVSDTMNNRVLEYTTPFSTNESASIVIGQQNFTGDNEGTTASYLFKPDGLAFDSHGNLWVSDYENDRVLEFTPPFSTGESASIVIGQQDFTSSVAGVTASNFEEQTALAFDSHGNLWVADNGNNRVLEFTPPFSTGESASIVIGQQDFTSSVATVTASSLEEPDGLAFDSHGNLWVSDTMNNRVLEFTAPFSTNEPASIVVGQQNFTSGFPGTTASYINGPTGLAFDSHGNLWVSDTMNNRVLEFTISATTATTASSVATSSTTSSSTMTSATALKTSSSSASSSSSSSSSKSSGIPEFPAQLGLAVVVSSVIVVAYFFSRPVTRRTRDMPRS